MKRALWLLLPLSLACKTPSPQLWQAHGVSVTLTELRAMDGFADYQVKVSDAKQHYCYGSGAVGGAGQRRASFNQVIEADGYLFVPASCGGGNASKCRGWQAFATKPALHWLGNLTGKWDGQLAQPYEAGVFFDTGDMLEINDLLNHAESPRYAMAYTEANGKLVFDAPRTWTLNAERYAIVSDDAPSLLFRAGLAKLCGKAAELKAVQAQADKALSPLGRKLFAKALGQVKNANIQPSAFIPVGNCPPEGKP